MKKIYFFLIALLFTLSAGAQTLRGDVNDGGIVNIGDVTSLIDVILCGDEEEPDQPTTDRYLGTVDDKTTLEPEEDVAHVQWGGSWRMPTKTEQDIRTGRTDVCAQKDPKE